MGRIPDQETLAVNAFKAEGATLFHAERSAAGLLRAVGDGSGEYVTMRRDFVAEIAEQFARSVAIAKEYHLGAAEHVG